jgi:hypothetical protein
MTFIVILREDTARNDPQEWIVLLKANKPTPAMTRAKRMVRKRLKRRVQFTDMMAFNVERSLPAIVPF